MFNLENSECFIASSFGCCVMCNRSNCNWPSHKLGCEKTRTGPQPAAASGKLRQRASWPRLLQGLQRAGDGDAGPVPRGLAPGVPRHLLRQPLKLAGGGVHPHRSNFPGSVLGCTKKFRVVNSASFTTRRDVSACAFQTLNVSFNFRDKEADKVVFFLCAPFRAD